MSSLKNYTFPPLSLLSDIKGSENENFSFQERVCNDLFLALQNTVEHLCFCGVNKGYNYTSYIYNIEQIALEQIPATKKRVVIAIIAVEKNYEIITERKFLHDKESSILKLEVRVYNELLKSVSLKVALQSEEDKRDKLTLFANDKGVPCFIDLKEYELTVLYSLRIFELANMLKCALLGLTFYNQPNQLKYIVIGEGEDLCDLNGLPHLLFGKVINNCDCFYYLLDWLEDEINRRKQLLKDSEQKDIYGYNAINGEKICQLIIAVSDFEKLIGKFENYKKFLIKRIYFLIKSAKGLGVSFIFSSSPHPYMIDLGSIASARISFKTESLTQSYLALDENGAQDIRLHTVKIKFRNTQLPLYQKDGKLKDEFLQSVPYFISREEVQKVCAFLKENNSSAFNLQDLEKIENSAKQGYMPKCAKEHADIFIAVIKILKTAYDDYGYTSLNTVALEYDMPLDLCQKAFDYAVERKYMVKTDKKDQYKVIISKDEFEDIFGESC